ncbi:glycosyltransferase family 2 protein [Janibacter alittae]|uniref:Glycosyltransferase n=1 Tax=Janibacter alittae TaxID=3115209 RepID=A0ABZ2MHY8_9MICO
MDTQPSVDVVILSQGDRQDETLRALESARVQTGVDATLILVGNGWDPTGFPDDVATVHLEENVGPAEGRNIGVAHGTSEFVLFLDNDAWLPDATALARAVARFRADHRLGLVHARVADTDGVTLRRWVPRAHVGDPAVGGPAFSVCEGVVALRRTAYEEVGGFPGDFFFGHEGIELAWRLRDRDWELTYDPSVLIHHPATEATRHALFWRLNARNRVWVARRNLPWPLAAVYIGTWTAITIARTWRQPANLRIWFRGLREGVRTSPGGRRPLRWRTLWTLTRLGHPPVV